MTAKRLRALLAIPAAHWRLLVEALALLVALRAGFLLLPFTTLRRWLSRWSDRRSGDECAPRDIAWAVGAVSSRLSGTTCLAKALSVECMLRRRGHAPALKIGVRRHTRMSIDAHAWVECSGSVVMGTTPELTEYSVLSGEEPSRFI